MTNDLSHKNDNQRSLNLSETESPAELEPRTREFGASIDDKVEKGIDVDAYSAKKVFLFSSGRRRRASFIL